MPLQPRTSSSECQGRAMCVASLRWKNAWLCLALIFSHFTITTRNEPQAFRPCVFSQSLTPAVYCANTSAYKLSICACVHASLDGEPAPYGVPTVRCKRTLTSHGTFQSACNMYLNGYPAPSLPCGSPAPAWSPNLRPACTCSSWVSSPGSSPPCPDLSTEARRL